MIKCSNLDWMKKTSSGRLPQILFEIGVLEIQDNSLNWILPYFEQYTQPCFENAKSIRLSRPIAWAIQN